MPHILLTGAGFSRNWGGWLADEAFEYLLGHPQSDDSLRSLLWKHKTEGGGFEAAFSELQTETPIGAFSVPMLKLNEAIRGMFADMNEAFATITFEFQNSREYQLRTWLFGFDAIFTLNQDVLMEQHYLTSSFVAASRGRWSGWQIPGMHQPANDDMRPHLSHWKALEPSEFAVESNHQPYFKLHGSSNWFDNINGRPMLVIGGNKPEAIARNPILKWNHEQFRAYLSRPETRLMVIGYSFGDEHINEAIGDAAGKDLRVFIIDPHGVDVLNRDPLESLFPGAPLTRSRSRVIGASRRSLSQTFGNDRVEHGKLMRFFS